MPRMSFKPFHVAISEGSHVAVGISSKATDREDICLQTAFLLLCFPPDPVLSTPRVFHTSRFPHLAFSAPRVFHTPRFPHPAFSTPCVSHNPRFPHHAFFIPRDGVPRTPGPRLSVFHLAEAAMILPAAFHKFHVRKRTFVTLFGFS